MSNVVHLLRQGHVGIVSLEDREARNTFSDHLISGLIRVFDEIESDDSIKVVVIHGYDNYFCCGGTKDELLTLQRGDARFVDSKDGSRPFYDLLLQCKVPTIAAMQGHALGGGLAFACFADILVLGEENIYSANFMKYGFTPGMGATYNLPQKFGPVLGAEMLYSARNYFGRELKSRGICSRVVPKRSVIQVAIEIANELAEKPRISLMLLKEALSASLRESIDKVIAKEVAMHQVSFRQPEVLERIESFFA